MCSLITIKHTGRLFSGPGPLRQACSVFVSLARGRWERPRTNERYADKGGAKWIWVMGSWAMCLFNHLVATHFTSLFFFGESEEGVRPMLKHHTHTTVDKNKVPTHRHKHTPTHTQKQLRPLIKGPCYMAKCEDWSGGWMSSSGIFRIQSL